MSNVLLLVGFKLNQTEIERLYCVNKAQPKKQCHGKCHLTKQLAENNGSDEQPTPRTNFEESFKLNLFHQQVTQLRPKLIEGKNKRFIPDHITPMSRLFGKSVFQPPDNQLVIC